MTVIVVSLVTTPVFAAVTTEPAHRYWAYMATAGYTAALATAMLTAPHATRKATTRTATAVAVTGAALIPTVALVLTGSGQPEVDVVRAGAEHFWRTGTPYLHRPDELYDFRPYLPAMYLFGSLPGVLGDVRLWGAVMLTAAVWSTRGLVVATGRPAFDERIGLLIAFPLVALAIAGSGIDVPQAALTIAAIGFVTRNRYLVSGAVLGVTLALKPTALCAVAVLMLCAWRRGGARPAIELSTASAVVAAVFIVPVALTDPTGLGTNVVQFPAGRADALSPAGSPFPGVLLHDAGAPLWAQAGLVVVAAIVVAAWCWRRVTADPRTAALCVAVGWVAAFAVVPFSRAGYLVLPALVFFTWRFVTTETDPAYRSDTDGHAS